MDRAIDHSMVIEVAAFVQANQWRPDVERYVTCTRDGVVRLWSGSDGHPLKTSWTLQGPSAYVLAAKALLKHNVVAISSNDRKMRFFSFEPRFRLDLEYDCGHSCQAMAIECFAIQEKSTSGKELVGLTPYLVWGDNCGCLHFVVEDALTEMRAATAVPTVDAAQVGLRVGAV